MLVLNVAAGTDCPNKLYLNEIGGTWKRDTSSAGPGDPELTAKQHSIAAIPVDANGDSRVDVLVLNKNGQPNDLYLGDGRGGWNRETSTSLGDLGSPRDTGSSVAALALESNGTSMILVLNNGGANDLYNQRCPAGSSTNPHSRARGSPHCLTCGPARSHAIAQI